MSSRKLCSKGASDGQSLPERTRKTKKSTNQPDKQTKDQSSSQPEQCSRPGSAQQQAGEPATPATSPAPRSESMPIHTAFYPGLAHHKYNYQLPKLLVATFPLCLVLSLQKTGSTPVAVISRCVTKKLQP